MARSKTRTRHSQPTTKKLQKIEPTAGPSSTPDAASLIDKAHTLLAQSNFDLAIKFLLRALELESTNLEARELVGVAELEGGDAEAGREHLLKLFPPYTSESPPHPSPYLYLAQCAESPQEALGYYSTGTAMIEKEISRISKGKGKSRVVQDDGADAEEAELRKMGVTGLIAMIEIWMSDLCMEAEAEPNCDALISRALSILPQDPEVRLSLASVRMSQSRFDEAKSVILSLYQEIEDKEPFDETLPALPARLHLTRLMLEHDEHLPALSILSTIREEDELNVEGAYLEGWAFYLRGEALSKNPNLIPPTPPLTVGAGEREEEEEEMTAKECFEESMRSLTECANLFAEQDYPDEGIGGHVGELLKDLEGRGVRPAEGINGVEVGGEEEDIDVEMA